MLAHKDSSPQRTIKRIKGILADHGIRLRETDWNSFYDVCYSVRIELETCPGIGTNGKGFSKPYALASAYGEFMERFQNRLLFRESYGVRESYGLIKLNYDCLPDAQTITYADLLKRSKGLLDNFFDFSPKKLSSNNDLVIKCVPFLNYSKNTIDFLPLKLIKWTTISNGTCAGNTPEEAILQGMAEILERYVAKRIFTSKNPERFPTISDHYIDKLPEIRKITDQLNRLGFNVIFKDASLGGKVPVVASIIFRTGSGKYVVRFGADPVLSTALSRCISESFQGLRDSDDFDSAATDPVHLFQKRGMRLEFGGNPEYHFDENMLIGTGKPKITHAFQKTFKSNKDSLIFVKNQIEDLGYDIYIRNVSFLGFPSFNVYIPGLSELCKINSDVWNIITNMKKIKKCLLRLKKSSKLAMEECADMVKHSLECPILFRSKREIINVITETVFSDQSDIYKFQDVEWMLFLMYFSAERFEDASVYLKNCLNRISFNDKDKNLYQCILKYMDLKIKKVSLKRIFPALESIYGKDHIKILNDIISKHHDCFYQMNLPNCGNCPKCPAKIHCYYTKWKKVDKILKETINNSPIDQTKSLRTS